MGGVVGGLLVPRPTRAHLIEVGMYAAVYFALTNIVPVGEVSGTRISGAMGYFYYSTVMYTSLGLGDAV
jgi:hypothetical protein